MTEKRSFPGLTPAHFQHPLDAMATRALEATPGLDMLRQIITISFLERLYVLKYAGHCARVDGSQYPSLYRRFRQLAERLDLHRLPELYIKSDATVNAYAEGAEAYFVILHTGLLDIMSEDEVAVVMAHELGHVKCNHMRHLSTANMLREVGPEFFRYINIPLAPALLIAVQAAMANWHQKAEFSADRCALLGMQDVGLVQATLAKLTGFSAKHTEKMNLESLKKQARLEQEVGASSLLEKAIKLLMMLQLSHPAVVERIQEIEEWERTLAYKRILEGDYQPEQEPIGPFCKICPGGHVQPHDALFCSGCGYNMRDLPVLETPPQD